MVKAKPPSKPKAESKNKSVADAAKRNRCGRKADHLFPVCCECEEIIEDDSKALQCERCTQSEVWKCASCLGLSDELYNQLATSSKCNLHWFCDKCEAASIDPTIVTEQVIPVIDQLQTRTISIEAKLLKRFADLDQKFAALSTEIDDKLVQKFAQVESSIAQALDQYMSKISEPSVDKFQQKLDEKVDQLKFNMTEPVQAVVQDVVQDALKTHLHEGIVNTVGKQIQEDKAEEEEIEKRKVNVIVHGVPESDADTAEQRSEDDSCQVASMLHELNCDQVTIKQIIRLGKRPTSNDDKPRPMKLVTESCEDRTSLILQAKNLRTRKEGGWDRVFIHQDLTPRQREARKLRVQELKQRIAQGETDLILLNNGSIVKRRRQQVSTAERPAQDRDRS